MEKEIIERVNAGDDLMNWQLQKEGIKLEKEKIEKQEKEIEGIKGKIAEIGEQLVRMKGPKIIFGNVGSISGLTKQSKIRKQVIRDFIAKEQPDIMGMIETNLQEEEINMKGIGNYKQYQTKADINKRVMIVAKEELHPIIKDKLDNRAIAITIDEGIITIMLVYVTYKEDIKEVRQWIEKSLP